MKRFPVFVHYLAEHAFQGFQHVSISGFLNNVDFACSARCVTG